jgi:hypothetical protein
MPKQTILKVTKVGHYSPSSFDYAQGDTSELSIPLICSEVGNGNRKIVLKVFDIDARLWVAKNPLELDEFAQVSSLVTRIEKHGVSYNEGYELWRIHVKYPFQVPTIRAIFESKRIMTCLADLTYERAFPLFYLKGQRYIMLKNPGQKVISVNDIVVVEK